MLVKLGTFTLYAVATAAIAAVVGAGSAKAGGLDTGVRQVQIESRIVVVPDNFNRDIGVDWRHIPQTPELDTLRAAQYGSANAVENVYLVRALNEKKDCDDNAYGYSNTYENRTPYKQTVPAEQVPNLRDIPTIGRAFQDNRGAEDSAQPYMDENGPRLSTRAVNTQVLLDDGQTVVLGGLKTDAYKTENRGDKVPQLGNVPAVERLFQNTDAEYEKQQLLIMVAPHIVQQD